MHSIGAGTAGFLLQGANIFPDLLVRASRVFADLEMGMNAIERIDEYCHLDPEKPSLSSFRPPPGWPRNGKIHVENLCLKYPSRDELTLKNVSFRVPSGKRLGIIGRTGSGKSSLVNALFRIVEPVPRSVLEIDGVDVLSLGLQEYRSRLSIIPQEPTLFTGTVRSQLDPSGQSNGGDASMWRALELADLADFIRSLRGQLDHPVKPGGENFSVGQRQLLCLARALLHASSILIMDEATANVDHETDRKIQNMVRRTFHGTLLCVAHRLKTVANYDLVMVMEAGEVIEFDTPRNLLKKQGGKFYSMAKISGEFEHLVHLANGSQDMQQQH